MGNQRGGCWVGWGVAIALTLVLAVATPVRADVYICIGTSHPGTVDNLRVPQDASCTLNGTRVEGNIEVERNGTLHAYTVRVDGNIQSDGGALINVYQNSSVGGSIQADNVGQVNVYSGTFVGGSVQIKISGGASINGVEIDSGLLFDTNTRALLASDNTVGGDVQAFQNTGGLLIAGNTIGANLQCKSNVPAPAGWSNVVYGSMEDQCAAFDAPPPHRVFLPGVMRD